MLIGLTGRAGAGKDTACERMVEYLAAAGERGCRFSFAQPLKESVCALFDLDLDELEQWKVSEGAFLLIAPHRDDEESDVKVDSWMTMRTLLQRYGTEAHRGVFGDNFWVDQGILAWSKHVAMFPTHTCIFTDVRFDNEAYAILQNGGKVYEVVGPLGVMDKDAEHESERGFHADLISGYIINSERNDDYAMLDSQIEALLS